MMTGARVEVCCVLSFSLFKFICHKSLSAFDAIVCVRELQFQPPPPAAAIMECYDDYDAFASS